MLPKKAVTHVLDGTLVEHYGGLIDVKEHADEPLVLLNYTELCTYQRRWDEVTRASRGLIVDRDSGEVAALPFPKFFNVGEVDETEVAALPDEPFEVYEKLDGSMGVLYRDSGGDLHVATRGSFDSPQARRGTELLRQLPGAGDLPAELTAIFEIIHPTTRVVVDYGDREQLVLLGVRDRITGHELPWAEVERWAGRLGAGLPEVYHYESLDDLLEAKRTIPGELEGFVIRFATGLRVKLKGDSYLGLLRQRKNVSRKAVLDALTAERWDDYVRSIPEEFRPYAESVAEELTGAAAALEAQAREYLAGAPATDSQKEFALWVQREVPSLHRKLLFQLRRGIEPDWLQLASQRRDDDGE